MKLIKDDDELVVEKDGEEVYRGDYVYPPKEDDAREILSEIGVSEPVSEAILIMTGRYVPRDLESLQDA